MKNKMINLGICSLFIIMPITAATPFNNTINLDMDSPPEWATNYFIGYVGITDQYGRPHIPAGYIFGYCEDDFKGKYAGVITEKEGEESYPVGYLAGYIIGPFLLGVIGNLSNNQQTYMVGLGLRNETHFYFRLMAIVGPTYYMAGMYSAIEE